MTAYQLSFIAIVQGITEFLPISSSGHLAILHMPLGWPDQGAEIDVAVHVGTLSAVIFYLRREIAALLKTAGSLMGGAGVARASPDMGLLAALIIGTIPLAIVGSLFVLMDANDRVRTAEIIGWMTLLFAAPLYFADRFGQQAKELSHASWRNGLYIGIAQTFALVPGASRSGVTIMMARMLGFERTAAARYSMLLSIPAIIAAGSVMTLSILAEGNIDLGIAALFAAMIASLTAFAAIKIMMAWLERATLLPFVIYRVILGAALLGWVYFPSG